MRLGWAIAGTWLYARSASTWVLSTSGGAPTTLTSSPATPLATWNGLFFDGGHTLDWIDHDGTQTTSQRRSSTHQTRSSSSHKLLGR